MGERGKNERTRRFRYLMMTDLFARINALTNSYDLDLFCKAAIDMHHAARNPSSSRHGYDRLPRIENLTLHEPQGICAAVPRGQMRHRPPGFPRIALGLVLMLGCQAACGDTISQEPTATAPVSPKPASAVNVSEAPGSTQTISLDGQQFTVPEGFTIELAAGPDLVPRPIVADFDTHGDLYVADSSGTNDDVQTQLADRPHRILRLRDRDGDGRFDESTVFADRMMFPEGVLCHRGSVFVAAPPQIWQLTDADGDGVAEQREVWFDAKTLTGCANDLHGPYLGRDGWIYWCKGAFAQQTYDLADGSSWSTRAAHLFRRRLEGGAVESVMTGGMDNPVEMIVTPAGERIFTTTFLQHPSGGKRDGLIHAIYGGVYGKQHGVLDGHPRTGELMPVLSHLGPAAPSGLVQIESGAWSAEDRPCLLSAAFNLHQVTHHRLRPAGASYLAEDTPWLVSDHLDFHPTDVLEDADGSVLVVDTGGWYKLCCPTSQLHKPDVLGAIYRVRPLMRPAMDDPRGLRLAWEDVPTKTLVARLSDPRFAVRNRAVDQLGVERRHDWRKISEEFAQLDDARTRLLLVWAASRAGGDALSLVKLACTDPEPTIRQASAHVISVHRAVSCGDEVVSLLDDPHAAVRRAAAEAAGRLRLTQAIPAILRQAGHENAGHEKHRALEHSLTYALLEIHRGPLLRDALANADAPRARIAGMIALDQIPDQDLAAHEVMPLIVGDDARARQLAIWLVGRHPEWSDALLAFLLDQRDPRRDPKHRTLVELVVDELMPPLLREPQRQTVFWESVFGEGSQPAAPDDAELRRRALRWLRESRAEQVSQPVQRALAPWINGDDAELGEEVIAWLGERPLPSLENELRDALMSRLLREDLPLRTRLSALAACAAAAPRISDAFFAQLLTGAVDPRDASLRRTALNALNSQPLDGPRKRLVIERLPELGPVELRQVLELFAQDSDLELGKRLIDALTRTPAQSVLPREDLRKILSGFGEPIVREVQARLTQPDLARNEQATRLDELLRQLPPGDTRRGQVVFHSAKAACFSCHEMGYRGGQVGPDLTRIGQIRNRRDLLEAIVYPSASFVRSYEPVRVTTTRGITINGVMRDQTATDLVMFDEQRQERRILLSDIESIEPSSVSVMPSGLDQLLSPQELADVITFLEAAR